LPSRDVTATGLDYEGNTFGLDLPNLIVQEPLVGKSGLTPTAIKEADTDLLVRHVLDCGFNRTPIGIGLG
jgi:hypothetical protein